MSGNDDKSVFLKIENSAVDLIGVIRHYNGEYFLLGLFLGLNKPTMGWVLLGFTSALPTIILFKHSELFTYFKNEKIENVLLFLLLILCSDIYVLHCFGRALGFN